LSSSVRSLSESVVKFAIINRRLKSIVVAVLLLAFAATGTVGAAAPSISPSLTQVITCPTGQFRAEYFDNRTLSGTPTFSRCETEINQAWGNGGPGNGVKVDNFSARWTGRASFQAGTYSFTAWGDDGIRVWVDSTLIVDEWRNQNAQFKVSRTMTAGYHDIKVEYYEGGGNGRTLVTWQLTSSTSPTPTTATATPTQPAATATPTQPAPTGTSIPGATATPSPSTTPLRTFYVSPNGSDSNPGTQSQPWRTFYHAADTVQAGDTAIFEDGVYVETTTRPYTSFRNSGTATAPIVLKARNKHKAKIYFQGLADKQKLMIMGNKYVTIQDFEITQDVMGTNYNDVLLRCWADSNGNGADYCRIAGNYIHNAVEPVKTSGSTGVIFENNLITGARVAFGSFNGDRVIFRNNEILNATMDGIQTKGGTRSAQIYNNYIHTTGTNAMTGAAIYIGGGSCETCGLYDINGYEGYKHAVYNNIIVAEAPGKIRWGMIMQGCDSCGAYNNVVRGTVTALQTMKSGPWAGRYVPTNNPRFLNNIIDGCSTGAYFEPTYTTGTITVDYNLFSGCSSGVPSQAHSVTGDPQFVNPLSDWHLKSTSPAIGRGTTVTHTGFYGESINVSRNRDGVTRSTPWNVGAY
jgi:hypothetical protein